MTKISSKKTCYAYGHGPLINLLQFKCNFLATQLFEIGLQFFTCCSTTFGKKDVFAASECYSATSGQLSENYSATSGFAFGMLIETIQSFIRVGIPIAWYKAQIPGLNPKLIREGASSLSGSERLNNISCSRASLRLHRCKSGLL